jgi:hypothetical protein
MNKVIQNILNSNRAKDEKAKEADIFVKQFEIEKGVFRLETYIYCPNCDDYYLAQYFCEDPKITEARIRVYEDGINSSGNEYADGFLRIRHLVCPKGHKHTLTRNKREKTGRV